MNADAFVVTGSSHKICQDYTVANPEKNYIIVSDGCSSAPNSDFGSRLLTQATIQTLDSVGNFEEADLLGRLAINKAQTFANAIGMPDSCLAATLLVAQAHDNNIWVHCFGDGFVIAKNRNGKIFLKEVKFPSGAPAYLRYDLDRDIKQQYLEEFGSVAKVLKSYDALEGKFEVEEDFVIASDEVFCQSFKFKKEDFEFVALASDGLESFFHTEIIGSSKVNEVVPVNEILLEVINFKGYQGSFVQRRCNKAMKEFHDKDWKNYDDFSLAVLSFGDKNADQ